MKDGFIKVAAACPKVKPADCKKNSDAIINDVKNAAVRGVKLVVFPELAITGYTCGDLFFQDTLLNSASECLSKIICDTAELEIISVVGLPYYFSGKLYNCAAVIFKGVLLGIVPKTYLPNYGEYYEKRHFTSAPCENHTVKYDDYNVTFGTKQIFCCKDLENFTFGVEICEDLWVPLPPSAYHAAAGANIIANLSASSEGVGKVSYRRKIVTSQSSRLSCGYIYANAGEGESTSDAVFSGHNLIVENGNILAESKPFEGKMTVSDMDIGLISSEKRRTSHINENDRNYSYVNFDMVPQNNDLDRKYSPHPFLPSENVPERCEEILAIQATGLKKRVEHIGCKSLVVGISGGLDSTLALIVSVESFDMLKKDRKDIIAVTMPSFGTSSRTRNNATALCKKLGVTLRTINIKKSVLQHFKDINHDKNNTDVVFENAQARERTQILMDIANGENGIVVGTGDLSELALGFATYNGDHMSMYGVNAALPKTLMRTVVLYWASREGGEIKKILSDVVKTPISPELLPSENGEIAQKTEEIVGAYELHDFFIFYMIRYGFSPAKIFRIAMNAFENIYSHEQVLKCLKTFYKRFFAQQYKRSCLPDGPRIGTVALSPRGDWRMPSDASDTPWLDEIENIK